MLADASARAELHELEQAAAWLGHASLRPPAAAWEAISAEVDRDLSTPRVETVEKVETVATPEPAEPPEVVAPTPLHPRRRVSQWLVAAAAVVILAIGAVGVFALVNNSSSGSGTDPASEAFAKAERNPKARTVILRSADGRYSALTAVLPDGTGYLSSAAMPGAPAGRDLQLWSITPDGPVSLGLMRGHNDVHTFRVAPGTKELAITSEPRGGSTAPTGNPIVERAAPGRLTVRRRRPVLPRD